MALIEKIDTTQYCLDMHGDGSVTKRKQQPGPPERIAGYSLGIADMTRSAPHGGEVHPDGDEVLFVISGSVLVRGESDPQQPVAVNAGECCVVKAGEWHKVELLEPTRLIYLTPGPNGDHRPL